MFISVNININIFSRVFFMKRTKQEKKKKKKTKQTNNVIQVGGDINFQAGCMHSSTHELSWKHV